MKNVLLVYKKVGLTPLQVIEKLKTTYSEYKDKKIGYAGRLDPMAEGLLLLLIGEENKKRKDYEKMSKEYEFEVLFGIQTDTYDVMGEFINIYTEKIDINLKEEIEKLILKYKGCHMQKYPPYSSARVKGKPLFYWARLGKLKEIEIPTKEIEIYDLNLISVDSISMDKLVNKVKEKITGVIGDFRQEKIIHEWEKAGQRYPSLIFSTARFLVNCTSGTYVRSIANSLGKDLGTGGIALNISRKKIGIYSLNTCYSCKKKSRG